MASKRNRQRRLERVRAERRLAMQAERLRRKRQIQAGIGAGLALIVIVLGATWLLGGFDRKSDSNVAKGTCTWTLKDPASDPAITDTGHPPTTGERRSGFETMTIKTNLGEIQALIDLSKVPCTAASLSYLGEKGYYIDTTCHRLNTDSQLLQCGDPTGNGSGSPSYQFELENIPTQPLPDTGASASASPGASASPAVRTYYPKGSIVMANLGANTNGAQFSIIYGHNSNLAPAYTLVGTVTEGLDIVETVARSGATVDGTKAIDGKPTKELIIKELYLGTPPSASATSPSAPVSGSASATASPAAT